MDTARSVDASLYERDELAWLGAQARALREGRLHDLDTHNLAEFLDDMAASQRRELVSRLEVLLTHRIKIEAQPERHTVSWSATIDEQLNRIEDLLETSPSLRGYGEDAIRKAFPRALRRAELETGGRKLGLLSPPPLRCLWPFEDLLRYQPPVPPERAEGGGLSD